MQHSDIHQLSFNSNKLLLLSKLHKFCRGGDDYMLEKNQYEIFKGFVYPLIIFDEHINSLQGWLMLWDMLDLQ